MWPLELEERGASRHIYLSPYIKALIVPSSPHVGSGTLKNCELHPLYRHWDFEEQSEVRVVVYTFSPVWRPWDLEKFQALHPYVRWDLKKCPALVLSIGSGSSRNSELFLSIEEALGLGIIPALLLYRDSGLGKIPSSKLRNKQNSIKLRISRNS